jgi:hypothetical protein
MASFAVGNYRVDFVLVFCCVGFAVKVTGGLLGKVISVVLQV